MARSTVVEKLRDVLRTEHGIRPAEIEAAAPATGESTRAAERRSAPGVAIASGWTRVDHALSGGLRPGATALLEGAPGAGSLALASAFATSASTLGEPTLVLDGTGSVMPHAWVRPRGASAEIWVLRVGEEPIWPALDIALRAGAFGLIVTLEPGRAPPGVGARVRRLLAANGSRVLVTQWPGLAPPWAPTHRLRLAAGLVSWVEGPGGAAPSGRQLEVKFGHGRQLTRGLGVERRPAALPDRLRAPPRAPDRRPPSGRGGRTRRR